MTFPIARYEGALSQDHPERSTRREALIGVGVHGFNLPHKGVRLVGQKAIRELDLDLKRLGAGENDRRLSAFREASSRYHSIAHALLVLDEGVVLGNCLGGHYDRGFRTDRFEHFEDYFHMSHDVFLPYRPGGFLQVSMSLEGGLGSLQQLVRAWVESASGDAAGREVDEPYNDTRNGVCLQALNDYIDHIDPAIEFSITDVE